MKQEDLIYKKWKLTELFAENKNYINLNEEQQIKLCRILEEACKFCIENKIKIDELLIPLIVIKYRSTLIDNIDFMNLIIDIEELRKKNFTTNEIIAKLN